MIKICLLTFCLFLPTLLFAQDYYDSTAVPKKQVFVRLKDGTTLRGRLLSTRDNEVRLQTDNLGIIVLELTRIAEISEVEGFNRNGRFYFRTPFYTNYFVSPTAMTLRQGEATYQNTYLFFNGVNFGVTDNFTLGGGALFLPGVPTQLLFFTPKISFNRNGAVKVAAGTVAFVLFETRYRYTGGSSQSYRNTQAGGVFYGAVTFGDEEKHGTITAGWAYGGGEVANSPVITASYLARVSRRVAVMTENWLIPGTRNDFATSILSGGIRLSGERFGGDFGLWIPLGTGTEFVTVPYASFKLKFGKKKNGVD